MIIIMMIIMMMITLIIIMMNDNNNDDNNDDDDNNNNNNNNKIMSVITTTIIVIKTVIININNKFVHTYIHLFCIIKLNLYLRQSTALRHSEKRILKFLYKSCMTKVHEKDRFKSVVRDM